MLSARLRLRCGDTDAKKSSFGQNPPYFISNNRIRASRRVGNHRFYESRRNWSPRGESTSNAMKVRESLYRIPSLLRMLSQLQRRCPLAIIVAAVLLATTAAANPNPNDALQIFGPKIVGTCHREVEIYAYAHPSILRPVNYTWDIGVSSSSSLSSSSSTSSLLDTLNHHFKTLEHRRRATPHILSLPTTNLTINGVYLVNVTVESSSGIYTASMSLRKTTGYAPQLLFPGPLTIKEHRFDQELSINPRVKGWESASSLSSLRSVCPGLSQHGSHNHHNHLRMSAHWLQQYPTTTRRFGGSSSHHGFLLHLRLAPNTLHPGSVYIFKLCVSILSANSNGGGDVIVASANETVVVHVADEPLRAVIAGGLQRTVAISNGQPPLPRSVVVVFNGSGSRDFYHNPTSTANRNLSFSWHCTDLSTDTAIPITVAPGDTSVAKIATVDLRTNQTYRVNLTVSATNSGSTRVETASIIQILSVIESSNSSGSSSSSSNSTSYEMLQPPFDSQIKVLMPNGLLPSARIIGGTFTVSPQRKLVLKASFYANSKEEKRLLNSSDVEWSCISSPHATSSLPAVCSLGPQPAVHHNRRGRKLRTSHPLIRHQHLIVPPFSLPPDSLITFRVSLSSYKSRSATSYVASIVIRTSPLPTLGTCSGTPEAGFVFSTLFQLSCTGQGSSTGPLRYKFQVRRSADLATAGVYYDLCSLRLLPHLITLLPEGGRHEDGNNTVVIRAIAEGEFGARTDGSFTLQVAQRNQTDAKLLTAFTSEALNASQRGNTETHAILVASIASLLRDDLSSSLSQHYNDKRKRTRLRLIESIAANSSLLTASTKLRLLEALLDYGVATEAAASQHAAAEILVERVFDLALLIIEQATSMGPLSSGDNAWGLTEGGELTELHSDILCILASLSHLISSTHNLPSSSVGGGSLPSPSSLFPSVSLVSRIEGVLSFITSAVVKDDLAGEEAAVGFGSTELLQDLRAVSFHISAKKVQYQSQQPQQQQHVILRSNSAGGYVKFPIDSFPSESSGSSAGTGLILSLCVIQGDILYKSAYQSSSSSSSLSSSLPSSLTSLPQSSKNTSSVIIEMKHGSSPLIPLRVEGATDNPFIFSIPGAKTRALTGNTHDITDADAPVCRYWNTTLRTWEQHGVQAISLNQSTGEVECTSSHLTAFHGGTEIKAELNTIEREEARDVRALDPRHNSMMVFLMVLIGSFMLASPFARVYDIAQKRKGNESKENEIAFWRDSNRVKKLRLGARSWSSFGSASVWGMKRRHTWFSIVLRPSGDHMNSQKRLATLLVLLLNSAVVCALLVDTEQRLPFLSSAISLALMACLLAFPVPFVFALLFDRKTPKSMRVRFENAAMGTWLGLIMILASICSQGEGVEMGGLEHDEDIDAGGGDAADEDGAGGGGGGRAEQEAGGGNNADQQAGEGDQAENAHADRKEEKEDDKKEKSSIRKFANFRSRNRVIGGSSDLSFSPASSSNVMAFSPDSNANIVIKGATTGAIAGTMLSTDSVRGEEKKQVLGDDDNDDDDDDDEKDKDEIGYKLSKDEDAVVELYFGDKQRGGEEKKVAASSVISPSHADLTLGIGREWGGQEEKTSFLSAYCGCCCCCCCCCCHRRDHQGDEGKDRIRNSSSSLKDSISVYEWTRCDIFGIFLVVVITLGCSFILATLSWSMKHKRSLTVMTTLTAFGQDMTFRIVAILLIEFIILAPLLTGFFCYEGGGEPRAAKEDDSNEHNGGIGTSEGQFGCILPSDEPAFSFDKDAVVCVLHERGFKEGICVGWKIVEVEGKYVTDGDEARSAIRQAHRISKTFHINFATTTQRNWLSHKRDGKHRQRRMSRSSQEQVGRIMRKRISSAAAASSLSSVETSNSMIVVAAADCDTKMHQQEAEPDRMMTKSKLPTLERVNTWRVEKLAI
eukprot:jgi/Bigna1/91037/estExt_fgenesh1_pg.C_860054